MVRLEQKVPQGFSSWEATLPRRIAKRMRERECSVKSLTVGLAQEGHQVSRHRLGRIVSGKTPLSLGDAIGLGRVLFDDPRALFRTTAKEQ